VAVAPRLPLLLAPDASAPVGAVWGDTRLVLPDPLRDALGGEGSALGERLGRGTIAAASELPLSGILDRLPVALLVPRE
jgi:maltooligosyltrehalose synthase